MSIINGLRRLKSWEWILLFIFLVTIFLFRFKYVVADAQGLIRINRITGKAKVYEWDRRLGKFKLLVDVEWKYRSNFTGIASPK